MKSQVRELYAKGLRQLGEIPQSDLPRAKGRPSAELINTGYQRSIGQSGSITLSRSLLIKELGFQQGDAFQILRQGKDLILRKID